MGIRDKLDGLESRLQSLVEGGAARLFPQDNLDKDLAHRLVEALLAHSKQNSEGKLIAPNLFLLSVHPGQALLLRQQEGVFEELTQTLQDTGDEAGLYFLSPPVIRIVEDPDIALNQFQVSAQVSLENLAHTTDILVDIEAESQNLPINAYLIIDGTQIYPLDKTVINIGRRPDNQISVDDPRVSRVHAQIRAIKGRFILFDLDSTGGTFVNTQRVHQCALFPGDVISLAGFPLVYGQDLSPLGETQKYTRPEGN
jgi:hypothetical protein